VVSFTPKNSRYPVDRRLGGPHRFQRCGVKKKYLASVTNRTLVVVNTDTHFLVRRLKCSVPIIIMYKYAIACVKQLNLTVVSARRKGFVADGMITRRTASSALPAVKLWFPRVAVP
jgi:hypothetical protein